MPDTDWIGVSSLSLFAHSVISLKEDLFSCHNENDHLERKLKYQEQTSKEIINQLKQANKVSQDNEWQLQESLAHTENLLKMETEAVKLLKEKVEILEEKLSEVETFMSSEKGQLCLNLEEELAVAKLRVAELESEKDEMGMISNNMIENIAPNRWRKS